MKKLFIVILLFHIAVSNGYASEAKNNSSQSAACHLPVKGNVAYKDVTSLPVGSPTEVLRYGDSELQFGELWLPTSRKTAGKTPLVVFVHGGCWLNAFDITHSHAFSGALANAGYAVWSVEYRRTGDDGGGWPGSLNDVKAAIRHVDKLEQFQIDTGSLVLIGHSAGGHLALLAASELPDSVSGVIGLAAIVDIETYAQGDNSCQAATPKFMGGTPAENPGDYDTANPVKRAVPNNTILIHGDTDAIVPLSQASALSVEPIIVDGAGHFDMIHPGTPSFKALLRELARLNP